MLRNKKYGMGGAVQSFSSPMLAQGMQGGLSGFGTSGLGTFAKGGKIAKNNYEKLYNSLSDEEREELMREKIGIGRTPSSEYEKFSQLSNYHKERVENYFMRKMAKGGEIVDQYEGRTPADIWFNLSKSQRRHLLLDHANIPSGEISMYVGYDTNYDDLPHFVKQIVKKHFAEGQYAQGGQIASIGDSGIITDKNSMFVGKMATITGDLGNMYEVRVGERTTIVKKNGIKIIADEETYYAKGGQAEEKFFAVTKIKVQPIKSVSLWKNRISTQEPTRENILEFLQNVPKDERICIYITDIEKFDGELHSAYIPLYTNGAESVEQIVDSEGNVIWNLYPKKTFAEGGKTRKSGNVPRIAKKVAEVNALIEKGNELGLEVVDSSTTWQAPMKYKTIKYVNGILYIEYEKLDLYALSKRGVQKWDIQKDKVLKRNMEFDNPLNDIAKMYRKAIREREQYFADGGDVEDRDRFSSARTMGRDSQNWEQELKEYAGEDYKTLTPKEREEIIADMQKIWDRNTHFAKGGKISSYEVELEAVPNSDYDQYSHRASLRVKKTKKSVKSIEEAVKIAKNFIDENDLGGGNFLPAKIYKNGKHIGFISYNGRVWNNDQSEMKYAEGGKMNQKPSKYNLGDKVFTFYNPSKSASIVDVYFKAWDTLGGKPHENDTYFYELSLPNGEKKTLAEIALSSTPLQSEKAVYKSEEPKFIEYKGSEIMYEPIMKKYYANDVEFNSLKDAQKFLDSGKISSNIRGAYQRGLFADGGETSSRNKEIAQTILNQIGGINRLVAFTGAYNFVAINNGVSFRIKNPKANYIKITLNGKDLYDLEVGRIRGTDYKVVGEQSDLYFDMLKSEIEKFTGMYLSFAKGGKLKDNLYIEQLASISDASPALVKLWSIEENNLSKNDLSNILQGLRTNEINRFAFLNALLGDEERTSEIISYAKSQKSSKMAKGGEVGKTLDKTEKYWFERIKNSNSKSVSTNNLSTNDVLILNRLSSMGLVDKAVIKGTQEATFTFKEKHAKGGKIGFESLANKVAKRYVRKKVAKQYQDEYGKTYDAQEAKEVGNKVAGKVYQQQVAKKKIVRKLQRKTN